MSPVINTLVARSFEPLRAGYLNAMTNAAVIVGTATTSTTSATFVDLATLFNPFTKLYGATALFGQVYYGGWSATSVPTVAQLALQVNSVDYVFSNITFTVIDNHQYAWGAVRIPDVPAGAYTVKMRWRRVSGAGTPNCNTDNLISARMWEVQE